MNLVFASGFLLPQHVGPIEYFNGVGALAESKGLPSPLFHVVPPLGKSENRSDVLAAAIRVRFPAGPIHIIAHSMGGLDSRYLIARNADLASRIVSLTTLSTPFHGSPLADMLRGDSAGLFSLGLGAASNVVDDTIGRLIDLGAVGDLTKRGAEAGPDILKTHPQIRCRSYAASGRSGEPKTSGLLLIGHMIIRAQPGGDPNDGAVAVASATYGEFKESWACDHLDMVGHDLDDIPRLRPRKFDHIAKFTAIIDLLQAEHPGT
jgi:triacylglycerol lipase